MTYRNRDPWLSYADLLKKKPTPGDRIKYVRENLLNERGTAMTQPELQKAVGLKPGHHSVMRWEDNQHEISEAHARKLEQIGPYPWRAFRRDASDGISLASLDAHLRSLEAKVAHLATKAELQKGLDVLRVAIDAQANRDNQPGKAGSV